MKLLVQHMKTNIILSAEINVYFLGRLQVDVGT